MYRSGLRVIIVSGSMKRTIMACEIPIFSVNFLRYDIEVRQIDFHGVVTHFAEEIRCRACLASSLSRFWLLPEIKTTRGAGTSSTHQTCHCSFNYECDKGQAWLFWHQSFWVWLHPDWRKFGLLSLHSVQWPRRKQLKQSLITQNLSKNG
jgi:hypothetical protein